MALVQSTLEKGAHKRKAHTKSRRGCKNCKLRGVKCDEKKPCCDRCHAYGAACNYNGKTPDLEMVFDGTATIKAIAQSRYQNFVVAGKDPISKPPLYPFICPAIYSQDSKYCIKLNSEELDKLGRFQTRTILAIGSTEAAKFFQQIIVDLACSNPCLMHVIQTVTGIHDRYLAGPRTSSNSRLTISERYHLGQAAQLFNEELSKPIEPERRDGLWATMALLGTISWATIEASCPEEAWPLTAPDPGDLMWIKMSENKAAIWEIAQPMRPDSIWYGLAGEYHRGFASYKAAEPGIGGMPADFAQLYGLVESSTSENSPYHSAVRNLTNLLPRECTRDDIGPFVAFIAHFKPDFKELLMNRDPRAMLLIAYWYMKVGNTVWSLDWRSKLECEAICIYLEKYHWLERDLIRMLQQPKKWCGATSPYQDTIWCLYGGQNAGAGWGNTA